MHLGGTLTEIDTRGPGPDGQITFESTIDGTTLGRPYYADTGELMGGLAVPPAFRALLDRHLSG